MKYFPAFFWSGGGFLIKNGRPGRYRLLCRHQRHVFYGNNLFAKGACYGAKEKVEERNMKGYLYVGGDLVRINVGMEMTVFGTPAYHSLIAQKSTGMRLLETARSFWTIPRS